MGSRHFFRIAVFVLFPVLAFSTCSKTIGWGVLLWYVEEPAIPSGTVLPVYVRSNIEQLWIAGVPEAYRSGDKEEMVEIPLAHLELTKNQKAAEKRALEFQEYARTYAETLQDGLPVRDQPENNSRRVYRLKLGEIVKVLRKAEGVSAISTTGAPLPGDWLLVLTKNGAVGYCFSYRLKLFEHETGPLVQEKRDIDTAGDADLDIMLSRVWYPEFYGNMVASGKINIEELSKGWGFDSGTESGTARIFLPNVDLRFPYSRIKKEADRNWSFEGSTLRANLRSESNLLVQYDDQNGQQRSAVFVSLPETAENIIRKENERRQALFQAIFANGPSFSSVNFGTITFTSGKRFTWVGAANLPQGMLGETALHSGNVDMGRYLNKALEESYSGALAMVFDTVSGPKEELTFLYSMEPQGLRFEYVSAANLDGLTVTRSDDHALVMYFSAE
ncbi:MAG: SH3 domain-containing protein [Treponema sp.]|jgi:hypothetical protein|nr:SH3 domain-containing protein [Treponema sp.]